MITENSQFQISQGSQVEESLSEMLEEEFQPLLDEGLLNQPDLERYLSNEYSIFKNNDLALNQICQIKSKMDIESLNYAVLAYFCQPKQNTEQFEYYSKNRGQISSQFTVNLKNVPMYTIVYVSIRELKQNRFNMLVRNSRGECLGFFWKQRKCKKIQKILKMLGRIKKPHVAVILDQTNQTTANISQIEKISNVADEFVYIFDNCKHIALKIENNDLRSETFVQGDEKCCLQRNQNQLRIYSPNLSTVSEGQILNFLIQTCKTLQEQQVSALQVARGRRTQQQRILPLDFIFTNVFRVWGCSPNQVIVIISNLLMKQQQMFNKKELIQQQQQNNRLMNYDPSQHFPKVLKQGHFCKRCLLIYNKKSKKLKKNCRVICEGCSATFKQDIRLCPDECFAEFHHNIDHYTKLIKDKKRIRLRRKVPSSAQEAQGSAYQNSSGQQSSKNAGVIQQISFPDKSAEDYENLGNQFVSNQIVQKTKKLDSLLEENINHVKKLRDFGRLDILTLFLGANLNFSIKKMKELSMKHPQFNTGLTSLGSKVAQQLQKFQQYNKAVTKNENIGNHQLNTHQKCNKMQQNHHFQHS